MQTNKPLAKSLHTVTAIVRVARHVKRSDAALTNDQAVILALEILGYDFVTVADPYKLAAAAVAQLNKGV